MQHFKVKAVYDYASPHEDDLSFPQGQIITVTEKEDEDWYIGEYTDGAGAKQEGLFPKNFVEKYEPEPPPRPNRASRYKPLEAPAAHAQPPPPEATREAAPVEVEEKTEEPPPTKPQAPHVEIPAAAKSQVSPTSATFEAGPKSPAVVHKLPPAPKPAPAAPASTKSPPPPVAEKPSSFRDRIAAFNKSAAPPIAPFKPGGGPPSSFIKKPFVAPPPSRNAYVPPIRNDPPPMKQYRREEDPEIAKEIAQDQENAEKAGLSGAPPPNSTEGGEDIPKPTSLKERIALLQKQQMEQAQRVAQKEKPKRPPTKKRTESHERSVPVEAEGAEPEKLHSGEPVERGSSDIPREPARPPQPRRPSHSMKSPDIMHQNRDLFSDANDADQSGAGDTEDAGATSASVEDEDEQPQHHAPQIPIRAPAAPAEEPEVGDEEGAVDEDEEAEEDEEDAEDRRKRELRERMAKMSGGMGMAGMFGPPGGMPMAGGGSTKKKKAPAPPRKSTDDADDQPAYSPPPRMPMIPVPGMSLPGMTTVRSPDSEDTEIAVGKEDEGSHPITSVRAPGEVPDVEDVKPTLQRTQTGDRGAPPPLPQQRPVPHPTSATERSAPPVPGERPGVPASSRPVPPPAPILSPSPGSESDDEMPRSDATPSGSVMTPHGPPHHQPSKRNSYFASDEMSQDSSSTPLPEKRASRMPPIPLSSPTMSSPIQSRPPPPPPPGAPPSRQSTFDSIVRRPTGGDRSEGETEYEGDYDTDIASGATHKEALKSHARESSLDDSTTADDTPPAIRSPTLPGPPPLPPSAAPRAVPPPPPAQHPPSRKSLDAPRAAPPPIPPPRDVPLAEDDEDYDPYRYTAPPSNAPPSRAIPPPPPSGLPPPPATPAPMSPQQAEDSSDDELYAAPAPRRSTDRAPPPPPQAPPHQPRALPHHDRPVPPPPPAEPAPSHRPIPRKSLDVPRPSMQQGRPSMDQSRPTGDHGFIASDLDLGASSHWWTQPNAPPPSLQNRKDLLVEIDESRSGTVVEKAVFVLYMDYSQTIITARFDAQNVSDVTLEQRHDPPPARLRQDQLEAAHDRFGARIAADIVKIQNTTVGDGTPHALVLELLRPYPAALKPVATRAYGAVVYANLANASTLQYDEIRPGDIVTFRNARFQGKHGPMHAKYASEVGKPDHVGVVVDWDGTKKKVRAWEQGRESKKVKVESFKLGDLRSGECRVWRVMGKSWVGWAGEN
ncbi:hypothetical protein BU16DRAFT_575616 [Lophium mytilinum]|uniref:SH3 domain-containing protein n=1 Tax=Lophium mytilinum TaxID=390894 RepID=A0A6A6QAR0_9PEZI|nr:hypothetical protein BU16DRAFT_575616 [Lophium mytilinum]